MIERAALRASHFAAAGAPVAWRRLPGLAGYAETLAAMEATAAAIADGDAPEQVWLLEHPALYTAGTSARRRISGPATSPFIGPGAADSSPIMALASAWPTSCWT